MHRVLAALIGSVLLAAGLITVSQPAASAHHTNYYGDSSRAVARHIGCLRFYRPGDSGGRGEYNLDSGDCWLKGRRVSVITYRGPAQQREWNAAARFGLPHGFWWANGRGAVVAAESGSKAVARVGARALPGRLKTTY